MTQLRVNKTLVGVALSPTGPLAKAMADYDAWAEQEYEAIEIMQESTHNSSTIHNSIHNPILSRSRTSPQGPGPGSRSGSGSGLGLGVGLTGQGVGKSGGGQGGGETNTRVAVATEGRYMRRWDDARKEGKSKYNSDKLLNSTLILTQLSAKSNPNPNPNLNQP